jgi:hypothetical protein
LQIIIITETIGRGDLICFTAGLGYSSVGISYVSRPDWGIVPWRLGVIHRLYYYCFYIAFAFLFAGGIGRE